MTGQVAPIHRQLPRGPLRDGSQPRGQRVLGEPGPSATPSHAVESRSVRPVFLAGEARAIRAPIVIES